MPSRSEAAPRESEQLARLRLAELEATYATAPVGLCVLDTDLRFVRINRRLAEINGRSVEEHIGRTIREVVPGVADEVEPVLRRILETGEPVLNYELTGETDSQPGVERTWLESWYPLRDEHGRIIGINVVADEITEKKRVEAERARERLLFEAVLDALPAGVLIADARGRIVRMNDVARELWGIPPETESWEEYGQFVAWWPETGERIRAEEWAMSRALLRGEVTRGELIQNQKFGGDERRYYLNNVAPVHDAAGRIVGGVAAMLDVTDRLAGEEALRESEAHLRRVIDNMLGFVAVTDVEGTLLDVNRAALVVAGITRGDVVGKKFWEGFWWSYDPQVAARVEDAVRRAAGGTTIRLDLKARIAGGGRITVDFMLTPVRDEAGEVAYLIPSGVDITARKRAEEAVRRLNETLEDRVVERTAQVQRLAAQLAVAEQEERERIAHVLHDDLQQQLYSLAMLLPLLRRSPPEEAERLLSQAEGIVGEATRLTRTLSTELSPSVLDSDRLVDSLLWLTEQKRHLYGLQVEVVADGPCRVPAQATRTLLYQTLREVLFNVVKHAGVKRARVVVDECGDEVVLRVEDDGRGFDAEAQTDGFGLAHIRSRLELVGGRFEVVSSPGSGTHITLAVPTNQT